MNWQLIALISGEAKKFIIANCLKILLHSERHAHNSSHAGYFTIMHDRLCHLATFLASGYHIIIKGGQVTKSIMHDCEIPCM